MLLQREPSTTNECQGCFNSFQFQFQKINKIKTLIFFLLPIANVKRQNRIFLQTRLLFFVGWFEKAKADIICQFKIERFDKRQLHTIVKSKLYQKWVKISLISISLNIFCWKFNSYLKNRQFKTFLQQHEDSFEETKHFFPSFIITFPIINEYRRFKLLKQHFPIMGI